jgi:GH15 family glucan-1,4-alpha-glucosidase
LIRASGDADQCRTVFATGLKDRGDCDGTWRDAEDGQLEGNPEARGSVDSVLGVELQLGAFRSVAAHSWVVAGNDIEAVYRGTHQFGKTAPTPRIDRTSRYWEDWLGPAWEQDFADLSAEAGELFYRSLLVLRSHWAACGGPVSACDGDTVRDDCAGYGFIWPRVAAFAAAALDAAGLPEMPRAFHRFCAERLSGAGGYAGRFLPQQFFPDGCVHTAWQIRHIDGAPARVLQPDATALALWQFAEHCQRYPEYDERRELFARLVRPAVEFLTAFRSADGTLPRECYDLWDERIGVHLFTTAAMIAGLEGAARLANAGAAAWAESARAAATQLRLGMLTRLSDPASGQFGRSLAHSASGAADTLDLTPDSSMAAVFLLGVLDARDPRVENTMRVIEQRLAVPGPATGLARYEADPFCRSPGSPAGPGNPWVVCSLWLADWYIAVSQSLDDLARARQWIERLAHLAVPGGLLPEQFDASSGQPINAAPLVWSHAAYVHTVARYASRFEKLGVPRPPELVESEWPTR